MTTTLFTPTLVGRIELPHRLAMAPMTRDRSTPTGVPTERNAEYYAQRGSLGLVISEGTQPSADGQGYLLTPGIHDQAQAAGWQLVADAVHAAGGHSEQMKALVVGATGRNSGMVVPELKRRGAAVRALIRDPSQAQEALRAGSDETVVADLTDPASLRRAAEGVDGVFHINPAFAADEAAMGVAMVDAASDAGVRKFVFSGVYHPSISHLINHAAKQPVEQALYESALDFTILQPAMYMQNLVGSVAAASRTGQFSMPFSKHAKVCYVDYRDVAEVAALALTGDTLSYGTFELCAPGMVDRIEIAALMSAALGRTIEAGESEPRAPGPGADAMQQGLARMTAHYDAHGFPGGNGLVLRAILGRQSRTLAQFFAEQVAA